MAIWNPWRGCHKFSESCKFCYIHKGDSRRGVDTNQIVKTEQFYVLVAKNKKGEYKIKSGQIVYLCFSTDFLIKNVELVVVGGESEINARVLDYDWVLSIREQCISSSVNFEFRQCGTHFIKDGKLYNINVRQLCSQARKAGINVSSFIL